VLLATTILAKWKITYDKAYNGLEAIGLIDDNSYDLVLTDIEMPEFDGLQLMKYIRRHADPLKANTLIMALTANALKEDRDKYIKGGANDVVVKPFLEHDLIEKISLNIQNKSDALKFIA
jgi:CheY-like chemotaxis protein